MEQGQHILISCDCCKEGSKDYSEIFIMKYEKELGGFIPVFQSTSRRKLTDLEISQKIRELSVRYENIRLFKESKSK